MLSILGVGSARPKNLIDAALLAKLGPNGPEYAKGCLVSQLGVRGLPTTLKPSYIAESGNSEPEAAAMQFSTTDLGFSAVNQAMERAGITASQLGLIMGDCSTQPQTTPSEAQRVAGRLGQKIDAYDVLSSTGSMALHIEVLSSWRPEKVPEHVVSLSSNTPTAMINYRTGIERVLFGDAAGALILSKKHQGKLVVRACEYFTDVRNLDLFAFNTGGHLVMQANAPEVVADRCAIQLDRALRAIESSNEPTSAPPFLIATCMTQSDLTKLADKFKIPTDHIWSHLEHDGNALGAAPICVLADHWSTIVPGSRIVVAIAGVGLSGGFIVLEALS